MFKVWLRSAPFIDAGICRKRLGVRASAFLSSSPFHLFSSKAAVVSPILEFIFKPASKRYHSMSTLSPEKWNRAFFSPFLCGIVCFVVSCSIVEEWAVEISAVLQYNGARLHLFYLVLNSYAIELSGTMTRLAKTVHRPHCCTVFHVGTETLCRGKHARRPAKLTWRILHLFRIGLTHR